MSQDAYDRVMEEIHAERLAAVRERVEEGAAWLDGFKPTWWRLIDTRPSEFDMESGLTCVWGQLAAKDLEEWFGPLTKRVIRYSYGECCARLYMNGTIPEHEESPGWMATHGFYTREFSEYGVLREAWVDAIAERKQQEES